MNTTICFGGFRSEYLCGADKSTGAVRIAQYESKQVKARELHSTNPKTGKMGHIISIVNQKGGCGKTTTAVNLSAWLASKGKKTLLIDLDPEGYATLGLGIKPNSVELSIYDVLINNISLERATIPAFVDNLDLIPSNPVLSGAQLEIANLLGRETILRVALNKLFLSKAYDFVILDCSPSLNLVTINALAASKFVIVPIQAHYYSLHGMKELFSTITIIKERINADLEILGILVTLFDPRTKMSHHVLSDIRDYFKDKVFGTVVNTNVKLCEASMNQKPICLYDPESKGSKDYEQLTDEVIARILSLNKEYVAEMAFKTYGGFYK